MPDRNAKVYARKNARYCQIECPNKYAIHTYITLHYIPLHYITFLHTYILTYIPYITYITYIHYIHYTLHTYITYITYIHYIHTYTHTYSQMVCQNSSSGWGSLEESNFFIYLFISSCFGSFLSIKYSVFLSLSLSFTLSLSQRTFSISADPGRRKGERARE